MRLNRFMLAIFCVILLAPGCIVLSVHPHYSEDQIRFDESLLGQWDADGEIWSFSKKDDDRYLVTITQDQVAGIMEGTLFTTGGHTFMDMYPWDFEYKQVVQSMKYLADALSDSSSLTFEPDPGITEMDLWWNNMHLLPTHSVLLVAPKDADTLQLAMLNVEWLADQLKNDPELIAHVVPGSENGDNESEGEAILLTAPVKDLQRFIATYADDEDAFELETLERVK